FEPKAGIWTERLSDKATGVDFVPPAALPQDRAREFSFRCNEEECSGAGGEWDLVNAGQNRIPGGDSLKIRLHHRKLALEVLADYRVYDGQAAVRKHLVLKNTGREALRLTHLAIEALNLSIGPANEMTLLTQYGAVPRETFYTGRSEDAGLFVANGRTGAGVAILSEVPGWMKRTEIGGWDRAISVPIAVLYDTALMPFERTIAPGAEFKTAAASLVTYRSGEGFNDPRWRVPSYTAAVLERRVNALGPPWI